tara:strand:- start:21384 stop:23567 length:2184 start_codon:yes stop_codon:yes gene_type:complete
LSLFHKAITTALLIRDSIKKGEGSYIVDPETGEIVFLGGLHPDQYHDNNPTNDEGWDLPKTAHYGNRVANGEWNKGPAGENVWIDQYGKEHRHGIDAVIFKVAQRLKIPGKAALEMVRNAIEDYNDDHVDAENQSLPDPESPEWRKMVKADFANPQSIKEANTFTARGKKGSLITMNMSLDPKLKTSGTKIARHPESYSIPFAPYLHEILKEQGYESKYDEGITHGYIGGKNLSPSVIRLTGRAGQNLNDDLELPPELRQELGHSSVGDMVHSDVHNWEMIQHMPLALFNAVVGTKGGAPVKSVSHRNYLSSLSEKILNNAPPEVLDEPILGTTLREAFKLGNADKVLLPLVQQMAKSKGALGFMIGNPKQAGVANSMVDIIRQELLEHPELKGQGAALLENARKRITSGKKHGTYGSKKGGGLHDVGAEMLALSGLIGDPSTLANFSNELFTADEDAEEQRKLFTLMGGALTAAHGGQVRQHAPVSGESTVGMVPRHLDEHMDPNRPFPKHIQSNYIPRSMVEEYDVPQTEEKDFTPIDQKQPAPLPAPQPVPPKPDYSNVDDAFRESLSRRIQQDPSVGLPAYFQQTGRQSVDPLTLDQQQRERLMEAVKRFGAAQSPYQAKLTDPYPVATSFDTVSIEDRLVKAMERIQMLEAKRDASIIKQLPNETLSISKEDDVSFLAMKLGITKQDVKVISNSKGDWDRIAKAYRINPSVVKVVKVTLGGT